VFVFYLCERAMSFRKSSSNIKIFDVMQPSNCEYQIQPWCSKWSTIFFSCKL